MKDINRKEIDYKTVMTSGSRRLQEREQQEAPPQPDHIHHLPASRARARVREVSLPRRLLEGGARDEGQPARSQRAGTVSLPARTHAAITGDALPHYAHDNSFCAVSAISFNNSPGRGRSHEPCLYLYLHVAGVWSGRVSITPSAHYQLLFINSSHSFQPEKL